MIDPAMVPDPSGRAAAAQRRTQLEDGTTLEDNHELVKALDGRPYPPRRAIGPGAIDGRWPIGYKDVWLAGFPYSPPTKHQPPR